MGLTQEAVDALEELPAEKKVEAYKTALLQDSATDAESSKAKVWELWQVNCGLVCLARLPTVGGHAALIL